jgi:hypothetical protein
MAPTTLHLPCASVTVRDDGWRSADHFGVKSVWVGSDVLRGFGCALQKVGGSFYGQGAVFLIKRILDDLTGSLLKANSQI